MLAPWKKTYDKPRQRIKKQVAGLKNNVKAANKRADSLGGLSAKRGAAVAKFVSGWDRKANAAASKSARSRKKK